MAVDSLLAKNSSCWKETRPFLFVASAFAFSIGVYALIVNINGPVLDSFAFRQGQTAISAYYIAAGGPILAYETPVVGFPWSIPFEFPIYQIIVALLSKSGIPLDAAGRLVSYLFFLGCLFPFYKILQHYKISCLSIEICTVLFLSCPVYVFWSRTFLIETTALFFSLMWLWLFLVATRNRRTASILFCIAFGVAASLTKSTTFLGVLVFGCIAFVAAVRPKLFKGQWRSSLHDATVAGIVSLVPFAIGYAWVLWTDHVKDLNQFGHYLTSNAVSHFTFGTIHLRISGEFWQVFSERILHDIFGYVPFLALFLIAFTIEDRRKFFVAAISTVTFLLCL